MIVDATRRFFRNESAGGILLISAAALALAISNSPLAGTYFALLDTRVAVIVGALAIDKSLLLWINDGLMAIFFFHIGLELKREVLQGHLAGREQRVLPIAGAIGGFIVPAVIYAAFNWGDMAAMDGWAIPSATDIAFALGVLTLLGDRVPLFLKVFLSSLAICDDLAAIVVIALFYSGDLSLLALLLAGAGAAALVALNRAGVEHIPAYAVVGIFIWVCVLKSGVHATLAGVIVALAIPMRPDEPANSPLHQLEHGLESWVAFAILPLFAFANAGVTFDEVGAQWAFSSVSYGIVAGLFFGKQAGVFAAVWLAIRTGMARMPSGGTWGMYYGVSLLTGIGFTMRLFIGSLAFERGNFQYVDATRIGVLVGSVASALLGYLVLRRVLSRS